MQWFYFLHNSGRTAPWWMKRFEAKLERLKFFQLSGRILINWVRLFISAIFTENGLIDKEKIRKIRDMALAWWKKFPQKIRRKIFFCTFFDFSLFEKVKNRKKWKKSTFHFFQKVRNRKKCKKNIFRRFFLWQLFSLRQSRISYFTDFLYGLYVNIQWK